LALESYLGTECRQSEWSIRGGEAEEQQAVRYVNFLLNAAVTNQYIKV
jgi:hypothetical protein